MAKSDTATEAPEQTEESSELNLKVNIGNTPPSELFTRKGGAGRTRQPTVFDDDIEAYYEAGKNGKWVDVECVDSEGNYDSEMAKEVEKQIRRCATFFDYGLELRHNEGTASGTIGVWFKVGDKSNRGRPKGVRKNPATGNFEVPTGQDADGNYMFEDSSES